MTFNLEKLSHKLLFYGLKKNVVTPYTLNGHTLDRDHHHSYYGIILLEELKWASHVSQISASAKQTLGVIRRNFRHTSVGM